MIQQIDGRGSKVSEELCIIFRQSLSNTFLQIRAEWKFQIEACTCSNDYNSRMRNHNALLDDVLKKPTALSRNLVPVETNFNA